MSVSNPQVMKNLIWR